MRRLASGGTFRDRDANRLKTLRVEARRSVRVLPDDNRLTISTELDHRRICRSRPKPSRRLVRGSTAALRAARPKDGRRIDLRGVADRAAVVSRLAHLDVPTSRTWNSTALPRDSRAVGPASAAVSRVHTLAYLTVQSRFRSLFWTDNDGGRVHVDRDSAYFVRSAFTSHDLYCRPTIASRSGQYLCNATVLIRRQQDAQKDVRASF